MPVKKRKTAKTPAVRPRAAQPAAKTRAANPAAAPPRAAKGARKRAKPPARMLLRLYIAGTSVRSTAAIQNARRMCDEHLAGRYSIEVIDLLVNPVLARGDEIVAVPTLVRKLPEPIRKIIGDLSDTDKVLVGLQIRPLAPGRE